MPGPVPKPANLRQRRNRHSTAATLLTDEKPKRSPSLPKSRDWHPLTRAWWRDVWHSPMAGEFLQADLHGLYILADLVDRYWISPSAQLAAEIRLQRQCFGLTPIDRRRLQWEVQRVESAEKRRQPASPVPKIENDPRDLLKAIK